MMWLGLLRRFWPYIAACVALAAVYAWHAAQIREADQSGYKRAVAEYKTKLAEQRELDIRKHQESEREWQSQLADIQRRSVTVLSQPVRLCVSAPGLPAADPVAGTADAGPGRGSTLQASGDLGPALREYGEDCERFRRQVRQAQRDSGL